MPLQMGDLAMLELQHLFKSYRGIPAVQDVSFKVAPGEIVGLLGPNGAGKSTTVKMITACCGPTRVASCSKAAMCTTK